VSVNTITEAIRRFASAAERTRAGAVQASWNGMVLAESERTIVVEGNHYFPPDDVRFEHLQPSDRHTVCPWKGSASYYDVVGGGERNAAAAWYYPNPSRRAERIADHVAFWHGVEIRRVQEGAAPQAPAA
jgi:uncharacterized protein (DUF427 family)